MKRDKIYYLGKHETHDGVRHMIGASSADVLGPVKDFCEATGFTMITGRDDRFNAAVLYFRDFGDVHDD